MKEIRYVLLDPTGNLTALVLDPVEPHERPWVTEALMKQSEQVGYLTEPKGSEARARLEMMGGEFCGNASMATAVYLASLDGPEPGKEEAILLEVSGADGLVACRAKSGKDGWRGAVEMPLPTRTEPCRILGTELDAVYMPGMVHLIYTGPALEKAVAEALLEAAEERFSEPAMGLLQYDRKRKRMIPLVRVRESGTQVWETACGSGTAAVGYLEAVKAGSSVNVKVCQPGGVLRAEAEWRAGRPSRMILSGTVRLNPPQVLTLPS